MDIFRRPPSVSEDTLCYTIHPPASVQDKASTTSLVACIHALTSDLLPNFLWHRDSFQLSTIADPNAHRGEDKYILQGHMRVGDSIDDEWCVVWLLREISRRWDVVISVKDSDGEFLLIEGADFLPNWVNPSNAVNRVWVHSGRLHLIPLLHVSGTHEQRTIRKQSANWESGRLFSHADEQDDKYIAVHDALPLILDTSIDTFAPKEIEDATWRRIAGYPGAARNHAHTTKVYLPVDIARALTVNPSLVQKPVEAFYTRDGSQLRAAHRMTRFPPHESLLRNVQMTRTAYAQLMGQKFYPPKVFGPFKEPEGTDAWRWRDVGMKLACGFEMLYQESKCHLNVTTDRLDASTEARKDALRRTADYKAYVSRLVSAGYFHDEIEGSELWNELEDKASGVYIETLRTSESSRPSFATQFNAALSCAPVTISNSEGPEDSDNWRNIEVSSLDSAVNQALGPENTNVMTIDSVISQEDWLIKEQSKKLGDLAAKVERFVQGQGDLEGACFEDEMSEDDAEESDGNDQNRLSGDSDGDDFNERPLADSDNELDEVPVWKGAEREEAMAKLVPPLPASEYGQMPPSFNTQRVAKSAVQTEAIESLSPESTKASPHARPIRPPLLPRDKYEGADSDDESSSSDPIANDGEEGCESEQDYPQVEGEVEIDMSEEQDEFIEFSRQVLGITDDMWREIIQERTRRGAFVPKLTDAIKNRKSPLMQERAGRDGKGTQAPLAAPNRHLGRPNTNPNLDSFEAVMAAMDTELTHLKQPSFARSKIPLKPPQPATEKGKERAPSPDADLDIEAAMDAELKATLEGDDPEEGDEGEPETSMDYNLIKNFLESLKSQAGLSGPVGNLAGRLQPGWALPRDET